MGRKPKSLSEFKLEFEDMPKRKVKYARIKSKAVKKSSRKSISERAKTGLQKIKEAILI